MKKRQDHRKYQLYLIETLNSLDLTTREKILSFKNAIKDLLKTEELILPNFTDKKMVFTDKTDNDAFVKNQFIFYFK